MSQTDPGSLPPVMPVPVQALPYSVPVGSGRPGLITALAIMCIIVGCLSGFISFITGIESFGFFVATRLSGMASARTATIATASAQAKNAESGLLPPADTAVATNELTKQLSLSDGYIRELNKLLRSHGREIFGLDEDATVTAASIREAVTESAPAGPDGTPAHFSTAAGRVDVYADHAMFTSADGASTAQTSAANGTDATSQPASDNTASTSSTVLPAAQVDHAIKMIGQNYGVKLNSKQLATVRSALTAPNQQLITPGSTSPVLSATQQANGNVMIQFENGMIGMGPQGQVTFQSTTNFAMTGMGRIKGSTFALAVGEAVASLALAIYLFVLGILLFRTSSKMPRLLRIYALLKIPLACLAGAALPLLVYEMASSAGPSPMPPAADPFIYWGVGIAVLGCVFPIAVLITLRTRTVREYFSSVVG